MTRRYEGRRILGPWNALGHQADRYEGLSEVKTKPRRESTSLTSFHLLSFLIPFRHFFQDYFRIVFVITNIFLTPILPPCSVPFRFFVLKCETKCVFFISIFPHWWRWWWVEKYKEIILKIHGWSSWLRIISLNRSVDIFLF